MRKKTAVRRHNRLLATLYNYAVFFLLIAFVISCCMLLFLHTMQTTLDITFTKQGIRTAAALTMGNVLFLSFLCTVIDALRRQWTVERPVRRIVRGAEKLMQGDFSERIEPLHGLIEEEGFDIIIDCFNRMAKELSGVRPCAPISSPMSPTN